MEGQKYIFTQRGVKAAIVARELHQTMLIPGRNKMYQIACDGLIKGSPVATNNISHTNHIYGTDVLGLKGKGIERNIPYISVDIIKVPPSITSLYRNVTTCYEVLVVNKVTLFVAVSLNIQYGHRERLLNRHITTFLKVIKHMSTRYAWRGFLHHVINTNP